MPIGDISITELINTPIVQLLIVMLFLNTVSTTARSLVETVGNLRKPKNGNGHSNGNGYGAAKDIVEFYQGTIDKMFDRDNQIVTAFNALTTAVNTHMEHDTARRTLHEMNGLKIGQQSQTQEALRREIEQFGQYNIRAVQSGAAREIAFSNLVQSVQDGQGVMIGLLQEIRDYLKGNGGPNGTEPHSAAPAPNVTPISADAGAKAPGLEKAS